MGEEFARAIEVHSIAEEYQHVRQQRCPCGGRYRLLRQALLEDQEGRPYDRLEVACERCGAGRRFLFDIRSFFGL